MDLICIINITILFYTGIIVLKFYSSFINKKKIDYCLLNQFANIIKSFEVIKSLNKAHNFLIISFLATIKIKLVLYMLLFIFYNINIKLIETNFYEKLLFIIIEFF